MLDACGLRTTSRRLCMSRRLGSAHGSQRQDGDRHRRLLGDRCRDRRKLREAGVRVAGGARRVERVDADVALPLDVTDEASSRAFVEAAVDELGGIDILFNNAGLALGRVPFTESTAEDEATVLHTNVDGVLRMTRLCLPHIRDGATSSSWARSPGGRRTRTARRTSRRSSRVRGFSVRAARGPARPSDPDHDGRRRARRDRVLRRPLQGRPGEGGRGVRGGRARHRRTRWPTA